MENKLTRQKVDSKLVTEGSVSVTDLLENVVVLLRERHLPLKPEDFSRRLEDIVEEMGLPSPASLYARTPVLKAVAYVSPEMVRSDKKRFLGSLVEEYVGRLDLDPATARDRLDVYVFGGDGFIVQRHPGRRGMVRVKHPLNAGNDVKSMFMARGYDVWKVTMDLPETVQFEIGEIRKSVRTCVGCGDGALPDSELRKALANYFRDPRGLKKDLCIDAGGAYDYSVKLSGSDDTRWDATFEEWYASLEDCA